MSDLVSQHLVFHGQGLILGAADEPLVLVSLRMQPLIVPAEPVLPGEHTSSTEHAPGTAGDPDQTLVLYTVEPGSPSEHTLHMLASWTADNTHTQPEEAAENEH
ncbi:hypothetical protein ACFV80_30305 [Streptomyces sp. NPDC059862]|uniref:hypothetical protein n=1 Tax=Streptomyces sp. NPDC059862 TaxID=3346975 RepID=UPI00364FB3B7